MSIMGNKFMTLIIIMSIFNWTGLSIQIRAEIKRIKKYQFIDAAKILGSGKVKLLLSEILPNIVNSITTFIPFYLITAITILTGLDYLGFGLADTIPSWGKLLKQGIESGNLSNLWITIFPLTAFFLTLLLLTFVGEGLSKSINPDESNQKEQGYYD